MTTNNNSSKQGSRSNSEHRRSNKRVEEVKKQDKNDPNTSKRANNNRKGRNRNKKANTNQKDVDIPKAIAKNKLNGLANGDCRYTGDSTAMQYQPRAFYTDKGIPVNPQLNVQAIEGVAASLLQRALFKGYAEELYPNDPVDAANFICQILFNAAAGGEDVSQHIPSYLGIIKHSVSPKNITYNAQLFNYAFQGVPSSASFSSLQPYGGSGGTGKIAFGEVTNQTGAYGLNIISPTTATADLNAQAQAYVRLTQHLADRESKGRKWIHNKLSQIDVDYLEKKSAAYSCPTITYGGAFGNSGGDVVRLGNETPVDPEVLGVFSQSITTFAQSGRAPNCNSSRGGGAMEAVLFTTNHNPQQLAKLTRPVLKFINFNNLFYVYCKALQYATQLFFNDPQSMVLSEFSNAGTNALKDTILPKVTLMEAALAFRNVMMLAFSNTQWASCSLQPTNATNETFIGFSGGVGTYPIPLATPLQLPAYLLENIRCLTGRWSPTEEKYYRWFIPVLGQYIDDEFDGSEFTIQTNTPGNGHATIPLFLTESDRSRAHDKKDKKDKVKPPPFPPTSPGVFKKPAVVTVSEDKLPPPSVFAKKVGAVFPINLWDGSSADGYLTLNREDVLQDITIQLNKSYTAVAKFVQCRSVYNTSPSANALCQLGSNYYIKRNVEENTTGYGNGYTVSKITYGYAPDAAVVEGFPMVPPTRLCHVGEDLDDSAEINVVASTNLESYSNRTTVGPVGLNWQKYLDSVAQMCVGDGQVMNSVRALRRLSEQGRGGIASDLISAFGGPVGALIDKGIGSLMML